MRTSEVAKLFDVHPNTVRLYEEWGYLPPIPRDSLGQRVFTEKHVAQMQLARCTLHNAPRCGPQLKESYKEIVWLAGADYLPSAIAQAIKHLALIKSAQERANHALEFLKGALTESIAQLANPPLSIHQAALFIDISVPILRRWEAYGLICVPRNPKNKYRIYGQDELGWLVVVRSLRLAGYKVSSCMALIQAHQHGGRVKSHRSSRLCDAVAASLLLFIDHEDHTKSVLDQLHRMTTAV